MRVNAGDDEYFDIVFRDRAAPLDLTTALALTWRGRSLRTGELVLTRSIGDGITVLDELNALLVFTAAETAAMDGPMAYELEVVENSGQKSTADKGVLIPSPDL